MSNLSDDIKTGMKAVGREWKKAKKRNSDRNDRVSRSFLSSMRYHEPKKTLRDAAFKFMEQAYNKASSNGKYYANARQIMYAARPQIIDEVGIDAWDQDKTPIYFQSLLKDYIEESGANFKVVWDARGHLTEPHTQYEIGLGGAEVMKYRADQIGNFVYEKKPVSFDMRINTVGPVNRYGAVLFIEKEGFDEQLKDAGIMEKWDIAIMSSKGIPNAATCNVGAMVDVPVLALHDFDLAGFKIMNTLRNGARLSRGIHNLIDIGLRLEDVNGLEPEPVIYKQREDPRIYLKSCGATSEECDFLVTGIYNNWSGQRVEINMLTTEQLIAFLERKFAQSGVKKVVPDEETLRHAYRRAAFYLELKRKAGEIQDKQGELTIPDGLGNKINDSLAADPAQSWDEVVWELAEDSVESNIGEEPLKKENDPQSSGSPEVLTAVSENLVLDQNSDNGGRYA
jgi:hypothetical protein